MNEIEQRLAEELGFSVTRDWHGGDDREPRIEWTDGGYDITHPKMHDLWRKCCELMQERDDARKAFPQNFEEIKAAVLCQLDVIAISLGYDQQQRDKLFGAE